MALGAIFLCVMVLGSLSLQAQLTASVNAAPLTTLTLTPTDTATPTLTPSNTATATPTGTLADTDTPTVTDTATATFTATTDPCSFKPTKPRLTVPSDGSVFDYTVSALRLRWGKVPCGDAYRVFVKMDSKLGKVIRAKRGLTNKSYLVKNLPSGHDFYWRVAACNSAGCSRSNIYKFTIQPPPTPTPTYTATPTEIVGTSTPAAGLAHHLANYQGPSVYLNSEDPVYYFDCGWKWRPFGDFILLISDGFTPGEPVTAFAYEISSGVYSMTGNYIAEGNGWVRTSINTHDWHGGHYHIFFTGSSSGIQHCGHFDLDHGPGGLSPNLRGPHKQ